MTAPATTTTTTTAATRLATVGIERAVGGLGRSRYNRRGEQLCFFRSIVQRCGDGALVRGCARLLLRALALRLLLGVGLAFGTRRIVFGGYWLGLAFCLGRLGLCLLRLTRLRLVPTLTGVPGLLL